MADDIILNSGSGGATLRTDDDGTAHWQYIKLAFGADNTQTIVGSISSNALPVALSDVDNAVLDTINTAVELIDNIVLAEDAVHSSGDSGVMALAVRNDVLAALAGTDGDYAPLQVNASGALFIQEGSALDVSGATLTVNAHAVTNAGTFVVQEDGAALIALQLIDNIVVVEDAVHSSGDSGVMPLAVRNDALAALAGTDGDYAPLQVNASGALFIQEGAAMDVSAATVTVDLGSNNDVTIDGSSIVKAEDAVHSSGDAGVMALVVRNDSLAALAGSDGDYAPLQVNASGALFTDVTAVVPGFGATNLGKRLDDALGSSDVGVMMLAVHDAEASKIGVAEEDFDHLHIGELGGLSVEPEQHNHLDEFDATTGWAALGNDTLNLATTDKHLTGSKALTFDKVDGAANTIFAGIEKTITTIDMGELDLHDIIQTVCYVSSLANIDYVFVRIGTSSSNYNEWRAQDDDLTAGDFQVLGLPIGSASHAGITGTGVDWGSISYIAVGVAFDNQNNTLSGIIFDQLGVFTGSHVAASISAEVSSSVSSPNVNVKKWGSTNVTLNAGNADTGTLRVVLATDQNFVKIEDAVHSSGDAGIMPLAVRNDTLAALAGTDGDYAPLQVNASGALFIQEGAALDVSGATVIVDLGSNNDVTIDGSSIVKAEDAQHSSGDAGIMPLAVRNDVLAAHATTDGDYAPFQVNDIGALFVTGEHREDDAHVTLDYGHYMLGVRDDALAVHSGTDGDYESFHMNDEGALWTVQAAHNLSGASFFSSNDLDESEEEVAATACTVYSMYFWNATAAPLWAQIFNATAASIAPGTDAPDINFIIPANADSDGAGVVVPIPAAGLAFGTALSVAITTGVGTNSGAPAANAAGAFITFKA